MQVPLIQGWEEAMMNSIARDDASAASRSIRDELRSPEDRAARRLAVRPSDSARQRH